eukprot:scaffold169688_cov29-Tisochrysis_lutea.AAC.10
MCVVGSPYEEGAADAGERQPYPAKDQDGSLLVLNVAHDESRCDEVAKEDAREQADVPRLRRDDGACDG